MDAWLDEIENRGRIEGRMEGRREGREEGKIEIVQEMLRNHQPLEFISKMTKFSLDRISEIGKIHGLL